jgi:hypothetical protein
MLNHYITTLLKIYKINMKQKKGNMTLLNYAKRPLNKIKFNLIYKPNIRYDYTDAISKNEIKSIIVKFSRFGYYRMQTHTIASVFFSTYNIDFRDPQIVKRFISWGFNRFVLIEVDPVYGSEKNYNEELDGEGSRFIYNRINLKELLNKENNILTSIHEKSIIDETVFMFKGHTWAEICVFFSGRGIIISGGSSTYRHVYTSNQWDFGVILRCLGVNRDDVIRSQLISKDHKLRTKTIYDTSVNHKTYINNSKNFNPLFKSLIEGENKSNKKNFHTYRKLKNNNNLYTLNNKLEDEKIPLRITEYLQGIKQILDDNKTDKIHSQRKIENLWIDILKDDLQKNKAANLIRGKSVDIFSKIHDYLISYKNGGYLKRKFPSIYLELVDIKFIYLTFSVLLGYYNKSNKTNLASTLGDYILWVLYKDYLNKERLNSKDITLNLKEYKIKIGMKDKSIKLGVFFIDLFSDEPLEIFVNVFDTYNDIMTLNINPEYIKTVVDNIIIHPSTLPMICKPVKWSDKIFGGFLENSDLQKPIITGSTYHGHRINNLKKLYNAINYLNNIQFSINTSLFDYITNEGKFLIENIKDNDSKNYINSIITLNIANIYSGIPFYLNTLADWRGRLYTQSFYLNYQGSDLSIALLELCKGEPLNEKGIYYLYIYAANCYGVDDLNKKTFDERYEWVLTNKNKIIEMDKDFILKADSPFLFTAISLVLKNLHNNPQYEVKLPLFLDATCSGCQHFAGLLLDFNLASEVNLIKNSKVKDFYQKLIPSINKAINIYGTENPTHYSNLMHVKLTRNELKSVIMTKSYNVTTYGIKGQLLGKFEVSDNKQTVNYYKPENPDVEQEFQTLLYKVPAKLGYIELNELEIKKMANIINNNIFTNYPSLQGIYNYLTTVAQILVRLGIPITWITPCGMKLTQKYASSTTKKLSISFAGRKKTYVTKEWNTNKIDKRKQVHAIIPNIIHSFDASHLINLLNHYIKSDIDVLPVHDCFGTHPNDMDNLASEVRKQFILLYSNQNFLENFHKKFILDIKNIVPIHKERNGPYYIIFEDKKKDEKVILPKVPKMGKLELKQIEKSNYMIN